MKFIDERWNETDDEEAEMALRGPSLCSGYVRNPRGNGENVRDGWFRTGDVFEWYDDGTYSFVSRPKYLIKPGGENVYPAELVEILIGHTGVEEVVVVRADDPDCGEVPQAVIGTDTIVRDYFRDRVTYLDVSGCEDLNFWLHGGNESRTTV